MLLLILDQLVLPLHTPSLLSGQQNNAVGAAFVRFDPPKVILLLAPQRPAAFLDFTGQRTLYALQNCIY